MCSFIRRQVSVLFSEPKIPQFQTLYPRLEAAFVSVLFSEPKIPQYRRHADGNSASLVSVLFSEPKIPQYMLLAALRLRIEVSVLFSEPKIPQSNTAIWRRSRRRCFSALQRAENSSIRCVARRTAATQTFQCSSASRKFLNWSLDNEDAGRSRVSVLFSEPKIPQYSASLGARGARERFQCSSASRKFLNRGTTPSARSSRSQRFSALQRAENSSIGRVCV